MYYCPNWVENIRPGAITDGDYLPDIFTEHMCNNWSVSARGFVDANGELDDTSYDWYYANCQDHDYESRDNAASNEIGDLIEHYGGIVCNDCDTWWADDETLTHHQADEHGLDQYPTFTPPIAIATARNQWLARTVAQ